MTRTYVIAEAGVNHNGSLDRALDLVDAAAAAGADAVKFQTFRSELVISINAQKADYQKLTTGISESQLEMVRKLELDENSHFRLMERARQRSIEFLSTPFDEPSVDFLVGGMGLSRIKIPSGEITNGPLLLRVASKKVPVIMSTGMATLKEIETALGVLAFGYCDESQIPPSIDAFSQAFESTRGKAQLEKNVVLLHCTTEYPAPVNECNLRAMHGMRETFGLPVGYSDHTDGIVIALAAVALGAVIIEKHFTLDRALPGPDHLASLEPGQLGQMVREIRMIEQALGDGIKRPQASERKNLPIARKSLMAARPIRQGEQFTRENVIPKRPNTGLSPMLFWEVAALTANRDYDTDEPLDIVVKVPPDMKRNWEKIFVSPNTTIKEAMRIINDGALRIALVVDGKKKLLGTIADGDIRRGLIGRIRLSDPVSRVMNSSPHVARQNSSQDDRLGTMRKYHLLQIPVLDKFGRVVGLDAIDESLEHPRRDNWILLMAGGYGTRLRPLTDDCPKPMLRVGGKPILENILEGFLAAGYHRFYLSVHYMQDKIRAYFGDGGRWNATIQYVEEDRPLGTAGALGLLPTVDGEPLIVMNADLLTRLNFIDLLNHHQRNKADITMCIREYDFQVPFGVVHTKGDNVIKIVEKPMYMHYVNAGIYVISPAVVKAAKRRKRLDMPELIESVIQRRGKVVKYAVHEYWLDVGRMDDFERAQIEFKPA